MYLFPESMFYMFKRHKKMFALLQKKNKKEKEKENYLKLKIR